MPHFALWKNACKSKSVAKGQKEPHLLGWYYPNLKATPSNTLLYEYRKIKDLKEIIFLDFSDQGEFSIKNPCEKEHILKFRSEELY